RVDDHHPGALAGPEGALAELLGHEPEVDPAGMQRLELGDRRLLGPVVHHRGVVAAAAAADDRLAVVARGQIGQRHLDVRGHPPAEVEPLLPHHASSGLNRESTVWLVMLVCYPSYLDSRRSRKDADALHLRRLPAPPGNG